MPVGSPSLRYRPVADWRWTEAPATANRFIRLGDCLPAIFSLPRSFCKCTPDLALIRWAIGSPWQPAIGHALNQIRDLTAKISTQATKHIRGRVVSPSVRNFAQGSAMDPGGLCNFPQCYPAPLAELLFRHQLLQLVSNHRPDRASTIPAPILALWPYEVTTLVARSRYL